MPISGRDDEHRGDVGATRSAPPRRAASSMPTASSVPSAWNPPTRLSTTRPRKTRWVGAAGAADRAQEARIEAFEHQRPIDQRQRDERDGGDRRRSGASARRRARARVPNSTCSRSTFEPLSETMRDAERERDQVEGGERGVLLQRASTRATSPDSSATARPATRPPMRHRRQRQAGDEKADRRARAGWHAPWRRPSGDMRRSIRKTPIGPRAERQRHRADQRAAHELELGEGRDEEIVGHGKRSGCTARRSAAGARRLGSIPGLDHAARLQQVSGVSTSAVAPQATGSRASSRRLGKMRRARRRDRAARRRPCAPRRASAARDRGGRPWSWRRSR